MVPLEQNVPIQEADVEAPVVPQPQQEMTQDESIPLQTTLSEQPQQSSLVWSFFKNTYQGLADLVLVIAVVLMSFFIYDVDVCIIKGEDEQEAINRQVSWGTPSGRVVVRNEDDQSLRARMTSMNLV